MEAQYTDFEGPRNQLCPPRTFCFREGDAAVPGPIERWRPRVGAYRPRSLAMPLPELVAEARAAADFITRRWWSERAETGDVITPGLELSDPARRLPSSAAIELLELIDAVQQAHRIYQARRREQIRFSSRRCHRLLRTVAHVLGPVSHEALALWPLREAEATEPAHRPLEQHVERALDLLRLHAEPLEELSWFNLRLPEELTAQLTLLRVWATSRAEADEELALRNRLAQALQERLGQLRRTAREVFHAHPAIVREVTSAYDRQRRARHRARSRTSRTAA